VSLIETKVQQKHRLKRKKISYCVPSLTVKRVDEVVRYPHLVTQDQFTQVSKKFSDIPAVIFTINIELFRQTFTNVLLSDALPLRHALFLISSTLKDKVYHILRNTFLLDLVHPS
jgi:hypothetical protein